MLSRLLFGRSVALKWMPSSALVFSGSVVSRSAATKPPSDSKEAAPSDASPDFFQKYMDVDNMVSKEFIKIQNMYKNFYDAQRDIEVPLDGDEAKVEKYHAQISKLREQHGVPNSVEITESLIQHKKELSGGSVRKFMKGLEATFGDALFESMMGIIAEAEEEAGTPLRFPTEDNPSPPGWSSFTEKFEGLMDECGLEEPLTQEEILYNETKEGLEEVVEQTQNAMDEMCEKFGIPEKVDAREIRTTITRDIE